MERDIATVVLSRLIVEPLTPDHAHELFAAVANPQVYQFIGGRPPVSVERLTEGLQQMAAGPDPASGQRWWNYVVRLRDTGELIGRLEATGIDDWAETAFLFNQRHWGHGYAAEAMNWFHRRLLEDVQPAMFWATVYPPNQRSSRLLLRLGYQRVDAGWPALTTYDPGDLVYCRPCAGATDALRTLHQE